MITIEDICRKATALDADGEWEAAESIYRQILAHAPGHPLASFLYANALLAQGRYAQAWPLFQARLGMDFYRAKGTSRLPRPLWDGAPAPEATVLIHVDQGLGDLIMCARYIPLVADRVGRCIFAVSEGTRRLFRTVDPRVEIVEIGEPVPDFDLHAHAFSLPALFGTTLDTIPPAQCLRAEPDLVERWRLRLGDGPKVGLCWQGNPRHPRDIARSIALVKLAPLLRVPGIRFLSLQVGHGVGQLEDLPPDIRPENLEPDLLSDDVMVPAAAAIRAIDLVICVDSGLAHLAGALGAETWIPLPYSPDWRWLRHGERTPWYPTARLFRQTRPRQWGACVREMADALTHWRDSIKPSDT